MVLEPTSQSNRKSLQKAISGEIEDNAIISVDCGTNTTWAARYNNIRKGMEFSLSSTLSSMANGLPYAIRHRLLFHRKSLFDVDRCKFNGGDSRERLYLHAKQCCY